jgi:Zn-dependent peptidase ImmA (M78 family)
MTNEEWVQQVASGLSLADWTFVLVEDAEVKDARVVTDLEHRKATIHYNAWLPIRSRRTNLAHEIAHVLLADMDFVACNGRSIDLMEVYNMHEERVCNVIARLLLRNDGSE